MPYHWSFRDAQVWSNEGEYIKWQTARQVHHSDKYPRQDPPVGTRVWHAHVHHYEVSPGVFHIDALVAETTEQTFLAPRYDVHSHAHPCGVMRPAMCRHATSHVPRHVPSHTPSHVPSPAPSNAPSHAPPRAALRAATRPGMCRHAPALGPTCRHAPTPCAVTCRHAPSQAPPCGATRRHAPSHVPPCT